MLLVEPEYYTRYPPLGLLKLSSFHKERGRQVLLVRGTRPADMPPDYIQVTSLFTYSWAPVHKAVEYYRGLYPRANIAVGGIYASLMPEHASLSGADEVHEGLVPEADGFLPDYELAPGWDSSIVFSTRGCVRECGFCAVPRLEGRSQGRAGSIRGLVHPKHKKVVLWDNNMLGVPNWRDVLGELRELGVEVDFNQGLDARFVTEEVARQLSTVRIRQLRMAYDIASEKRALERAIPALERAGFRRKDMVVYTLHNFTDTPDDFLRRVIDLLSWGVVSFPMRYEPLNSLTKNRYVSPHWTAKQLEMVARARRVLGTAGAFPPWPALLEKFRNASSFEEAFSIKAERRPRGYPEGLAGIVEEPTAGLRVCRTRFREVLNDPTTLRCPATCGQCGQHLWQDEPAFAVQDYGGKYVGYVCPACHPDQKRISGVWRWVLGDIPLEDRNGVSQEFRDAIVSDGVR